MRDAIIVATARTPIGRAYRGAFNETHGATLAGHVIRHAVARAGAEPADIEDVVMGCALQQGATGQNIARQAAIRAGLPPATAGTTVDRQCGSGLQAIAIACARVTLDGVRVAVGGGALESQRRTDTAQAAGRFDAEIVPLEARMAVADKATGEVGYVTNTLARDEGNRPDTTAEGLAALKPVRGEGHVITAGNASQLSDDASAVVVMEAGEAGRRGLAPLGRLRGLAVAGCEPDEMGIGPMYAPAGLFEIF